MVNNTPITKQQDIAETFANSIAKNSLLTPGNSQLHSEAEEFSFLLQNTTTAADNTHPLLEPFTPEEVKIALTKGRNSAPSPDRLKRRTIKNFPPSFFTNLLIIFNSCLQLAHYPAQWKEGNVICIKKPYKRPDNPDSYRPITLLSTIGKALDRLLTNRLTLISEEQNILPPFQHGFRRLHNTCTPALNLHNEIVKSYNNHQATHAVFLDVQRAFDSLWHAGLLLKLSKLNIPLHFLKLISSFLSNRNLQVIYKDAKSTPFTPLAGTPQGSPLSPLLYIIFCSDIPTPPPGITLQQFADDTVIWTRFSKNSNLPKQLKQYIHTLSNWFTLWNLKLNPTKCTHILFANSLSQKIFRNIPTLLIDNTPIPRATETRYLGINFHQSCSLNPEINIVRSQIATRRSLLYTLIPKHSQIDRILIHAYKTIIRPIIDYRATILISATRRQFESIQQAERKTLRRLVKVKLDYPSSSIHGRCSLPTLEDRLQKLLTKFATKIIERRQPAGMQMLTNHHHHLANHNTLRNKPSPKRAWPPSVLFSFVTDIINNTPEDDPTEENQEENKDLLEALRRAANNLPQIPEEIRTLRFTT